MTTYIAILRGVNVGSTRMKMDALRTMCEALGFKKVETYIQSGNVVFQFKKTDIKKIQKDITEAIFTTFNFKIPVLVKELDELKQIAKDNPFIKDKTKDISFLHITFLEDIPLQNKLEKIKEGQYQDDAFELIAKSIYLYCPNGYSNCKLTNSFLENKLKVAATTRNWKTTNELIAIAERIDNK
jgi:uncharacterized protein (DUF1697 family)